MCKISDEVINFIEKTMKTWRGELTAEREKLNRSEDPERYIPGRCTITINICNSDDAIQPHTQECTGGYKLKKSQEKNQSPNVHGRHQTVCKKMKKNWKLKDTR